MARKQGSHGLSRRGFTTGLIAGGTLAAWAAGQRPAVAQAPAVVPARALEKEMVFSGRGGTLGNVWRSKVIPPFERKFNCKVTYVVNDSVPALAKVVAERANPQTDVLWSTDQTHVQGKAMGVFEKLDFDRIPNHQRVYDFAHFTDGVGITWSVGGCVFGYNTKIYGEKKLPKPASWDDPFVVGTKGHVAWLDLSTLQGITAFLMINKLQGGTEANVDPAFKYLKDRLPHMLAIVSSPAQLDDLFQQNEAWIAPNVDGRVSFLKGRGFPVDLVHCKEGVPQIGVQLDLIKGAAHPNLAHEFVNWALSDEMQTIVGTDMGLGPVNKHLQLDAKTAENLIYGPDRINRLVQFEYDVVIRDFARWLERWNRELSR